MEEEKDTVARMSMALGFSFAGEGQSIGQGFLALKDWSEREGEGQDAASIARRANAVFSKFKEAKVMVNQPAAIPGLGTSAGFDFRLEDRSGVGYNVLTEACQMLLEKAVEAVVGKQQEQGVQTLFQRGGIRLAGDNDRRVEDFEVVAFVALLANHEKHERHENGNHL